MRLLTSVIILSSMLFFSSCPKKDEFNYRMNNQKNAFAFVFSNSSNANSGQLAQNIVQRIKKNQISGLSNSRVTILAFHPSEIQEPLNSLTAKAYLNLFNESGNKTFSSYPNFINNLQNYTANEEDFITGIKNSLKNTADVSMGQMLFLDGNTIRVKLKLVYNTDINFNHSIAVFAFYKEIQSPQTTNLGNETNFVHHNVLQHNLTNHYGNFLNSAKKGDELELEYTYSTGSIDLRALGVASVVFKLDENSKPIDVINVISNN